MSTELERLKSKLKQTEHDLTEREKELNLIYGLSRIFEEKNLTKEDVITKLVRLFPPAWQWPEVTCARITVDGQEYKSDNFEETRWKQASDIFISDKKVGSIEVYYLKEMAEFDEGPFLKEERIVIDSVAERLGKIVKRLDGELALIKANEQLSQSVLELSSPIIKMWESVLAVPIIGILDSRRAKLVTETLLNAIVDTGSKIAIIDITGVGVIDTQVANHIIKTLNAVRLLGAKAIVTGISPEIAQTLVDLGITLGDIITSSTLSGGLIYAFKILGYTINNKR